MKVPPLVLGALIGGVFVNLFYGPRLAVLATATVIALYHLLTAGIRGCL
jgi:uncharacterized membrane protein YoaK (UPF0700 family)